MPKKKNILESIKSLFYNDTKPSSEQPDTPAASGMKKLSFEELQKKYRDHTFDFENNTAEGDEIPGEEILPGDFSYVFKKANIRPIKEKWGTNYLVRLMENAKKDGMEGEQIAKLIKTLLKTENISVEQIIEDVIEHDKAIDHYEQFLVKRITERHERLLKKNKELMDEIEKNTLIMKKEKEYLGNWLTEKESFENKVADLCIYLGDRNIMTVGLVTRGAEGRAENNGE